jgi:hypothetical protein
MCSCSLVESRSFNQFDKHWRGVQVALEREPTIGTFVVGEHGKRTVVVLDFICVSTMLRTRLSVRWGS